MKTLLKRLYMPQVLCLLGITMVPLQTRPDEFVLTNSSVREINQAFDSGRLTSEDLVRMYIKRIECYDRQGPEIKAVLTLNSNAVATARALDAERREKGPRSLLHGIPVLAKDVFDTSDMPTTGGYLPLKGVVPAKDCTIVARLRDAGAIILAKVNQSDWYSRPDAIASSTLGGNTKNPYALDRTPGWSSSGTSGGLAAHFGKIGLGSETGFSIRTPTSDGNLYGLSTTSGLISRAGQMWSYITGERGGPMTHNMYDLCATLDVIAGFDADDLWTAQSLGKMPQDPYISFLDPLGLKGVRVGVLEEAWDFTPVDEGVIRLARKSIQVFRDNGSLVFDPVTLGINLPDYLANNPSPSRFERIHAINQYLRHQSENYPFKSAQELLLGHEGIPVRDTDIALLENPVDLDRDPRYRAALEGKERLKKMVLDLMDRYSLDAIIYPHKLHGPLKLGNRNDSERQYRANQLSPVTGLPAMIVPMGFTEDGLPVGLEILGRPWSEPTLIRIASGFEAVTSNQRIPDSTPPLPGETIAY